MYENQVALLLQCLDTALKDERIALKGGTAINLFIDNLPRFSVDIDLCYLPVENREKSLQTINDIMHRIASDLQRTKNFIPQVSYTRDKIAKQIFVQKGSASIKIEVNHVLRGSLYKPQFLPLCEKAQKQFQTYIEARCLSTDEIYAGKFCAALDRQHPRDLFDVMRFFEKNLLTGALVQAFLVYLISGNRPISEIIFPNLIDQRTTYENEFRGMTESPVSYEDLEHARIHLIESLNRALTPADREFLLSVKQEKPNWSYLPFKNIEKFPAIHWKLQNIGRMSADKKSRALEMLQKKLQEKKPTVWIGGVGF